MVLATLSRCIASTDRLQEIRLATTYFKSLRLRFPPAITLLPARSCSRQKFRCYQDHEDREVRLEDREGGLWMWPLLVVFVTAQAKPRGRYCVDRWQPENLFYYDCKLSRKLDMQFNRRLSV